MMMPEIHRANRVDPYNLKHPKPNLGDVNGPSPPTVFFFCQSPPIVFSIYRRSTPRTTIAARGTTWS